MNSAKFLLLCLAYIFLFVGLYGYYLSYKRCFKSNYKRAPKEYSAQTLFPFLIGSLFLLLSGYCWFQLQTSQPAESLYRKVIGQAELSTEKNIKLKVMRQGSRPLLLQVQPQSSGAVKKTPLRYSVHIIDEQGALILKQSREHRVYRVESAIESPSLLAPPTSTPLADSSPQIRSTSKALSSSKELSSPKVLSSSKGLSSTKVEPSTSTLSTPNEAQLSTGSLSTTIKEPALGVASSHSTLLSNKAITKPYSEQDWLNLPSIHINPRGRSFTILLKDINVKGADLLVTLVYAKPK